ncbi:hypothetical protein DEJ50_16855 [Streptomyces venezuelae]|uniref:Uncharacterized protein n=1 Tax=Streptomyces venezuelae TaxID=54571 RepID=A0A5P2D273_STRVZ|nr:hypothetical protein [Streptomyces venezuelae]QES49225.1 hypothetical protein DEJ50_16855 [Streptomyces venezuelae]
MGIAELQVSSVEEADGAGGVCIVRCIGGIARTGQLYAAAGSRLVLRRIEWYGRESAFLDAAHSAKVHLSGAIVPLLGQFQVISSIPVAALSLTDAEFWLADGTPPAKAQDLHTLRALGNTRMQDDRLPQGERIRWARVQLAAIERMGLAPLVAAIDAAQVRACLIRYLGPEPDRGGGDGLRDPAGLCCFVLDRTGIGPDRALRDGRVWRDLEPERILHLRRLKLLTASLEAARPHLADDHPLAATVDAWRRVRRQLP